MHHAERARSRCTRRDFLSAAVAGLAVGARPSRRIGSPPEARLTARPVRPWRPVTAGETRLGPNLERGALLYVPESYAPDEPPPLVLALHGGSGSAAFWRRWYDLAEERGLLLLAPDSRGRTWDRALGAFGPDLHFIDSALRHTFERCTVDESRIALAGFSDGASYTLSLGPSNGDLFTHLIAFSPGFSDPDDEVFGSPRIFISHGDADRVLSFRMTRDAIAPLFTDAGYDTRFTGFEGGHEMPVEVVEQALDWFLDGG